MFILYTYKETGVQSGINLLQTFKEKMPGYPTKFLLPHSKPGNLPNKAFVFNWGCSTVPEWSQGKDYVGINSPDAVRLSVNKIKTFYRLHNKIPIPRWTQKIEKAKTFNFPVFCRTQITSKEGGGIIVSEDPEALVEASLYTEYIPNNIEYRAYIFKNKLLGIYTKKKRNGWKTNPNFLEEVKTYTNGWCFTNAAVDSAATQRILELGLNTNEVMGLDFSGIDIVYSKDKDSFYVLEVNTAPLLYASICNKIVKEITNV